MPSILKENDCQSAYQFSLCLEPRSLLILQHDMYTKYLHGITERNEDIINDKILNLKHCQFDNETLLTRNTRVSLTIRYVPRISKFKLRL